jgi:ribosomal protein S18 acetylase RimI-like enzyme
VREADVRLLRKGLHVERAAVSHVLQEIEYLSAAVHREDGGVRTQNIRAMRCAKRVPELLFDNTRFACCLFKPAGLFHGEITQLLLDPATPMIELWSDPHPEFLGLVTLYPGLNVRHERVVLVDTFDYDDRLLDFVGYNRTMRFVLDSIAVDAELGGASKLIVFAAPYGKPVGFANFVRHEIRLHASMRYLSSYYFEAADPADVALEGLRAGGHHYTVALGYDRPMRGVIDYGYNHVGVGRVEKWLDGGRGVIEVDVARYLDERRRPSAPRPIVSVPARFDVAVHRRPDHHAGELARREASVTSLAAAAAGEPIAISLERDADPAVVAELTSVDASAFQGPLRYDANTYFDHWSRPFGCTVLARAGEQLVGFALCYQSPTGPRDLFLDVLAVSPDRQRRGIGLALLQAVLGLGTVWGFRRAALLTRHDEPRLAAFYAKGGFRPLPAALSHSRAYEADLGFIGAWARARLAVFARDVEADLRGSVARPRCLVHLSPCDDLIATMVRLERAFRPGLRYDAQVFRRRLEQWDALAYEVRDGDRPIAFSVISSDSAMPRHAIFFDSLCVDAAYQGRRIGPALHRANTRASALAAYTTAVFHCEPHSAAGIDLVSLYKSLGGEIAGQTGSLITMVTPIRTREA